VPGAAGQKKIAEDFRVALPDIAFTVCRFIEACSRRAAVAGRSLIRPRARAGRRPAPS
jgi:hypothetical protein